MLTTGEVWSLVRRDRIGLAGFGILLLVLLMAVFGGMLAPFDPFAMNRFPDGSAAVLQPPSGQFLMGTTALARDILSQILVGARTAVMIGLVAAFASAVVGTVLGVVSGYYAGHVDNVIQRLVEVAYSIPFEPLAIILVSILSPSTWTIVLAVSLVYWRQATRVVRTQVLSIRERTFIKSARVAGASDLRIMVQHITPAVLPVVFVYLPIAFANAIQAEAAISFLGFGDPQSISWGQILRQAFKYGLTAESWWWIFMPGLLITLTTASVFFCTRPFEEILNPKLRR